MAAYNLDTKQHNPSGKDDSSMEAGISTGEKVGADHVERLDTADTSAVTAGVKASQVYENMAPIAELGLPDWRATEKQLVRRLDMSLMPTIWLLYFNNYLDRTNIAQARLAPTTIDESLGLSGEDYNVAVSVLTAGYMLAQLPSNMLLTRLRPGVYLPCTTLVWSGVSIATAFTTNASSLFAVRFFLGVFEAPLFPGAIYLMSCWYTRKELALRISILYSGLLIAQAFSGIIAAGIFNGLEGTGGMLAWQWLFILEALMSVVCGIAAYFTLPDYPYSKTGSQKWTMNHDMRRLAEARMVADRVTGSVGRGSVFGGVKLCVMDPKTYLFIFLNLFMTASYGFNFYFPTMVQGFGIGSRTISLLLTSPPFFLGAFVSFVLAWNSDRTRERGYHVSAGLCAAAIGYIITLASSTTAARYTAAFFYAPGAFAANALIYSWAISSLSATPEKRAAAGAIVNILGHVGNIISPYFFRENERPVYTTAFVLMLVFGVLAFAMSTGTKFYLERQNKKLRERTDETGEVFNPYTT